VYGLWTLHRATALHLSPGHKRTPQGPVRHGKCPHPRHSWLPIAGLADVLIHSLRCLPEIEALVMASLRRSEGTLPSSFCVVSFLGTATPGPGQCWSM
jgi:hypothetical protein